MAQYKLSLEPGIILRDDGTSFPADPTNGDFIEYQAWVAAGGVPDPAETLEERRARLYGDLRSQVGAVLFQGVDGPNSLGDPQARSWPTNDRGQSRVMWINKGQSRETANPGTGLSSPYTLLTRSGDLGGVNDSTLDQLETAMFQHDDAVASRAKVVWQQIKQAGEAEMDAAEAAIYTGWPPPPVNP